MKTSALRESRRLGPEDGNRMKYTAKDLDEPFWDEKGDAKQSPSLSMNACDDVPLTTLREQCRSVCPCHMIRYPAQQTETWFDPGRVDDLMKYSSCDLPSSIDLQWQQGGRGIE